MTADLAGFARHDCDHCGGTGVIPGVVPGERIRLDSLTTYTAADRVCPCTGEVPADDGCTCQMASDCEVCG